MIFNIIKFTITIFLFFIVSCSEKNDVVKNGIVSKNSVSTLIHDGIIREYLLYIPEEYDTSLSSPLLFNFHGYGGTANQHMYTADMRPVADTAGFILVYPQGLNSDDGSPHWNTAEIGEDNKSKSDDFGFIEALINELSLNYNINQNKIYACGYSNGAGFIFSLACHLDRFSSIASISGSMGDWALENCNPTKPVGVMILHGTSDYSRPYDGIDGYLLSVDEAIEYWSDFNNTDSIPNVINLNDGNNSIEYIQYLNGDNNSSVEHYKINNGDHIWFNFIHEGKVTNQLIWNFLSKHSRD